MPKFKDSQELREQIVNIIDDLVNDIVPGYLLPNTIFPFDYKKAIYKNVYKDLWREFGKRRSEYADYREEVFDFLREVPSNKIFTVTELLLKVVCRIVYIQRTIPDNIIPNPSAGNQRWSRKESVRNRHIKLFKDSVDDINDRILKNNSKCLYKMNGESVHLVRLNTGSDVPEETDNNQTPEQHQRKEDNDVQDPNDNQIPEHHQNQNRSKLWNKRSLNLVLVGVILTALLFLFGDSILIRLWNYYDNQTPKHHQNQKGSDIQEPDDNQTSEHHQNQNRSELWNKRSFNLALVGVILTALLFLFGDSILIRLWNYLPTIKKNITGWFR